MRFVPIALLALLAGCSGSTSPTSPSSPPAPSAPRPAPAPSFSGTVTDTVTGAPIIGFSAVLSGSRLTVSAPGYITRETTNRGAVDLIRDAAPFDATFYRHFVRNGLDAPGAPEPLRRQRQAPRIYIRTIDDTGAAIDAASLAVVRNAIGSGLVQALSGGTMGVAGVEEGTDSRVGDSGWITVRWVSSLPDSRCGQASVGGDWIELLYAAGRCTCSAGARTYPRLVKHELGHAMGFYHTDNRGDVMHNASSGNDCDNNPSNRERYHAAIAYKRPVGNRDPDVDPIGAASLARVVID